MTKTNSAAVGTESKLALARHNEEAAYENYRRAFGIYIETHTDHIPVPASMFEASLEELVPLHPLFHLTLIRRDRMERAREIWVAAKRNAEEQTSFGFVREAA